MWELEIPRSELVEIATRSILVSPSIPQRAEAELMEVARTAPRILVGGWWRSRPECGCLVGTVLHEVPEVGNGDGDPLFRIGIEFDALLLDFLRRRYPESDVDFAVDAVVGVSDR